jgi:hypothetical protein
MTGILAVLRARATPGDDLASSPRVLAFLRAAGSKVDDRAGWNRRKPEPG